MAGSRMDLPGTRSALIMGRAQRLQKANAASSIRSKELRRKYRRQRIVIAGVGAVIVAAAGAGWLAYSAVKLSDSLQSASQLVPQLKVAILANDSAKAAVLFGDLKTETREARSAGTGPVWSLAAAIPLIGANFSAATTVAVVADDVTRLGIEPLVDVTQILDWAALVPRNGQMDVEKLAVAGPKIALAAKAVGHSSDRLHSIDTENLLQEIAQPLDEMQNQLASVSGDLDAAASATQLLPSLLGSESPRSYLLMIQNNAEVRATGGNPGALAVLNVEKGKITLGDQTSAVALGRMSSPIPLDRTQEQIYSPSMGTFMQDVNMTPDFPTAAHTALGMWEQKLGKTLDGALSVDPVALSYMLTATGPIELSGESKIALDNLPVTLTAENVVKTLLSDVYVGTEDPRDQDEYFALAARQVFEELKSEKVKATDLIPAVIRAVDERRVLFWSSHSEEQEILKRYRLSGAISGPNVKPAEFGVYFNDGTGAKMDFYMTRSAQVIEQCTNDGYREMIVRVKSTNNAPADASVSLPPYVTGGGAYGVPPGHVQTNVFVYGPVQANVSTVSVDGAPKPFAANRHGDRPVGTVTTRLAPGQSSTVDFSFSKIVQQEASPTLVVTPTLQPVKDVILASGTTACGSTS